MNSVPSTVVTDDESSFSHPNRRMQNLRGLKARQKLNNIHVMLKIFS